MSLTVYDIYGNNAAIECPNCGNPHIITSWNEEKRGARPCPHCNERHGIRFDAARDAHAQANAATPKIERTTRLLFKTNWEEQGVMCQFTAEDGSIYRYHHDDLLRAIVAHGSNLKNTRSWLDRGLYHFPRLSKKQKKLLEPYRIGKEALNERQKSGVILQYLNDNNIRCTYGAMADAIGVNVMKIGGLLGEHRPAASWVVNSVTLKPTGYEPENEHPDLYSQDRVITSGTELMKVVAG